MQAIEVKYLAPTANLGIRYDVYCDAARTIHSSEFIDNELKKRSLPLNNNDSRATMAAMLLCEHLGWTEEYYGKLVMGGLKNGNWVFVFTGRNDCNVIK